MGKKKQKIPALESSRYRKFIAARDRALEVMLNKARAQMHDVLRGTFQAVKERIALRFSNTMPVASTFDASGFLDSIDKEIEKEFAKAANLIGGIFLTMKMNCYTLALAGECEAIGQAMDEMVKVEITKDAALENAVTNFNEENLPARIRYAFDKLRRKIMNAVQLSRVQGSSVAEALERIDRALPAGAFVKRPPRVLKPLKEAGAKEPLADLAVGFYDEATWKQAVDYYLQAFVPTYRFRGPAADVDYFYRTWELEKDLTHEFVDTVRQAARDGAAINGITDFQWIAVLDDHTCEECCGEYGCGDFDTLSTREIEKMTRGEVVAPPAHYNCRCTIAPMLEYVPELPQSNAKEFDEWLNS